MTDDNENPSNASAAPTDAVNADPGAGPGDDTAERPEIQAEQPSQATAPAAPGAPQAESSPKSTSSAKPTVRQVRLRSIEDLMIEKESLILAYTHKMIPKPYYVRWKREANEIFQLLVRTRNRATIEK
jgi:hypothetical protein